MTLTDAQLTDVLNGTVGAIDGVLRLLADADPLSLKQRGDEDCSASGAAAWALETAHWPGTGSWDELSVDERAAWWVNRIGSVATAAVAFPGVFGVWSRALPLSSWLAYADHALILRAVTREYGVTSRAVGVAMLAEILFGRDVSELVAGVDGDASSEGFAGPAEDRDSGVVERIWRIGTTLYELSKSLDSRPTMPRVISWGTWIPFLGGPLTYVGERIALHRAVGRAKEWVEARPGTVTQKQ
ncbi:hypothetical protein [Gordonia sp. (in: high G+C Gram-positive bacteria)]|uniref:hypothetical protein n=1 Tax=Gordonia sp. (in: high G+C Gram-positive bacteria) TaxID=84139 RepID=UPI003F970F83